MTLETIQIDIYKENNMKIEFNEDDERAIEAIRSGELHSIFGEENGNYSLNIKVNDWAKASSFIMDIFRNKEITEVLKDKAGLEVTSVNLYTAISPESIKIQLANIISDIDSEIKRLQG